MGRFLMEEKTGKPGENLRSRVEIDWKPTYRRGTWGFPVLWCWCFFDAVMRWIKSQFAVLRWSQILRCRRFVFFTLRCWMKWNYLRCCGLLCDWVMQCSLIFFVVLRCSGPPHVPLLHWTVLFPQTWMAIIVESTRVTVAHLCWVEDDEQIQQDFTQLSQKTQ